MTFGQQVKNARVLVLAVCVAAAALPLGCAQRTEQPPGGESGAKMPLVRGIDRLSPATRARTVVLNFMDARTAGNRAAAESYLGRDAKAAYATGTEISLLGTSNPRLTSYFVSAARVVSVRRPKGTAGSSPATRYYEFDVGLLEAYTGQPYGGLRYERLSVGQAADGAGAGTFRILLVRPGGQVGKPPISANARGRELFLNLPGGKTRRLMTTDNLPNEISPQGAPPDITFGVGKEGFTAVALSPWAAKVAFGTWGTHGLIGWIRTAPPVRTWPVALDLIFEGTAVAATWSPSGRYLAVELATPVGSHDVAIYDSSLRKKLKLPLHDTFPPETYSLVNPTWRSLPDPRVVFAVERIPEVPGADPSKLGMWTISVPAARLSRR